MAADNLETGIAGARRINNRQMLATFLQSYSALQEYGKDYMGALKSYREHTVINDSLFSQEIKNRISEMESQREIDQRDRQLANARRTRIALISGAGALLIIEGLLFYQNRTRRKTNATLLQLNKDLDEANKIKTRFFGILSHDLRGPVANLAHSLQLQQDAPDLMDAESAQDHQKKLAISPENLLGTMETVLLWSKSQMERFAPHKKW